MVCSRQLLCDLQGEAVGVVQHKGILATHSRLSSIRLFAGCLSTSSCSFLEMQGRSRRLSEDGKGVQEGGGGGGGVEALTSGGSTRLLSYVYAVITESCLSGRTRLALLIPTSRNALM